MDLWLARKKKDGSFEAAERASLGDFAELFETDLAEHGHRLKLKILEANQEIEVQGWIAPAYSKLRKSGKAKELEAIVIQRLKNLLEALEQGKDPPPLTDARDAINALATLRKADRKYSAIIVC